MILCLLINPFTLHNQVHKTNTTLTSELLDELCEYCNRVFSRGHSAAVSINSIMENYCYHQLHGSDIMMVILHELHKLICSYPECYCTYINLKPTGTAIIAVLQFSTKLVL